MLAHLKNEGHGIECVLRGQISNGWGWLLEKAWPADNICSVSHLVYLAMSGWRENAKMKALWGLCSSLVFTESKLVSQPTISNQMLCVCVCVCLLVDPRFGIFLSLSISYFLSIWEEQRLWLLLPSSPGKCTGGAGARQTANDICNKVFRNHHPHFVLVRFSYRKKPAWKSHNRKLGAKINKLQKLDDALG